MVKKYSDDELAEFAAFYEEHGVVRLPGLVEPEWVDKILATIDETAKRADEPRKPGQALSFGRAEGRMTVRYMWHENPVIRQFMLQPALAEPVAKVIRSKQLRFWFDNTFIHDGSPDAAGVGTGWHHDIAAFAFKGMDLPSLWMAMTPTSADRSRLMFIDKSHETVRGFYRTSSMSDTANDDGLLDPPDFDAMVQAGDEKIITWDCEAGDAIVIHPYVIHGAGGNVGRQGRRVAITTRWLGDDVRFIPTPGATGATMPGMAKPFPLGSRPGGEYFPMVWPQREAFKSGPPN